MHALFERWARRHTASAGLAAGEDTPTDAAATTTQLDVQVLLQRLEWTVLRRLDGQLQGDYLSLFRGAGLELADLREYQLHDDVRHMDWNVTARMSAPYVREHQEDREVTAWLLVDASASVSFGSSVLSKRAMAAEWAGLMARLLCRRGNRVGAWVYGGNQVLSAVHVPARSGRNHVLQLMQKILQVPCVPEGETHLQQLLLHAQAVLKRRSTVFVVSDFFSSAGWEQGLADLARRHDVVAVRLSDPVESTLPIAGMVLMQDAESGEQLWVDTSDEAFRDRFEKAAQDRDHELRQSFARAGVDALELYTDEALDASLLRFTRMRKQRSQLAAGAAPIR